MYRVDSDKLRDLSPDLIAPNRNAMSAQSANVTWKSQSPRGRTAGPRLFHCGPIPSSMCGVIFPTWRAAGVDAAGAELIADLQA